MDTNVGASAPQPPEGLVTTEGVNEGSRKSAAESAASVPPASEEQLRRGGRPDRADAQDREDVRHDADREVIAGPWRAVDPSAPSLEQAADEDGADG
jgi:hypothetical protein